MTDILYLCVLVYHTTKTPFVIVINGLALAFNTGSELILFSLLNGLGVTSSHLGSCGGGLKVLPPFFALLCFLLNLYSMLYGI